MSRLITYAALVGTTVALGQQDVHLDRIGLTGGLTRYIGEIEQQWDQANAQDMAFGALSYQHFLGYGTSYYAQLSALRLQGNDLDAGNIARGLNFRSDLRTFELGFKTYLDNGSWLNYDARFAPFLSIGAGIGDHTVRVDQYNADGGRYFYWSDGTVRDLAETDPNAAMALVTGQDGSYETDVTTLATEEGKSTNSTFFFIPAQVGVKVRLSSRISLDLTYGFNWTFSDRLDDISGSYPENPGSAELAYLASPTGRTGLRGDPNTNDHYHYAGIGIGYSFGRRSYRYRMTPVHIAHVAPGPERPAPPVAPTPPPAAKEISTTQDELRIKRLVIDELVVDTIIVRRKVSAEATAPLDTMALPADTIPIAGIPLDTSRTITETDTSLVEEPAPLTAPDSILRTPPAHGSDSTVSVTGPDLTAPDSLREAAPPIDTLDSGPKGAEKAAPVVTDSIPSYEGIDLRDADPLPTPKATPWQRDSLEKMDANDGTDEKAIKTEVPAMEPQEVEIVKDRTAPREQREVVRTTTIIAAPVPENGKDRDRIKALEDSLDVLRMEQQRLNEMLERTASDTAASADRPDTMIVTRTDTAASEAFQAALVRSATYRRQVELINRMLMDRITLLEQYLALQEDQAPDSLVDVLRKQVLRLDGQVDSLRSAQKALMERSSAAERTDLSKVDANGDGSRRSASTDTVYFATASVKVGAEYRARISAIAAEYAKMGKGNILVTGHTDRSGKASFNLMLSQQRAEAVAGLLEAAGVPRNALKVKGLGEQLARSTYDEKERNVVIQMVMER